MSSANNSVSGADSLGSSFFNADLNATDPSSLLDSAFAKIQNFQNEVFIMMSDIHDLDEEILKITAKMEEEDSALQRYYYKQYKEGRNAIKQHNREQEIDEKIEQYLEQLKKLSDKKLSIATSLNYMATTKYENLKISMTNLSSSGQLSPLEFLMKEDRNDILKNFFSQKYKSVLNNKLLTGADSDSVTSSDSDNEESDEEDVKRPKANDKKRSAGSAPKTTNPGNGASKSNSMHNHDNKIREDNYKNNGITATTADEEDDQLYCFCQTVSFGEMVACDNNDCKYQWFHYGCIGLNEPPKGIWYCPDCRKKR